MDLLKELEKGVSLYAEGRVSRAERVYLSILRNFPENGDVLNLLGILYQSEGDSALAVNYFHDAIAQVPERADFHFNLAESYRLDGQYREAIGYYSEALSVKAEFGEALMNRGDCHFKLGSDGDAIADFKKSLELLRTKESFLNLARVYLTQGNFVEAESVLDRCLEFNSEGLDVWGVLAECYWLSKQYDRAKQICDKHRGSDTLENIAGLLAKQEGKYEEAVKRYERAFELNSGNSDALNNLGVAYKRLGLMDKALGVFERACELCPDDASYHFNLAGAYNLLHRKEEAILHYKRVLDLDPENESAGHMVNALCGGESQQAPKKYIESLFDSYADNFEQDLTMKLKYSIPEEMALSLSQVYPGRCFEKMYDAGCGTGLCGVALKGTTKWRYGVDLSGEMLAKAAEKGVYGALVKGDVVDELEGFNGTFELVVAADVFIYLGELDRFFACCREKLCVGGVLAFSVEECCDAYELRTSGRYAHSEGYICRLSSRYGLTVKLQREVLIRKDVGGWIQGFLFILERRD